MKKFLWALIALVPMLALVPKSNAAEGNYQVGHSSFAQVGVRVSSGSTATQINAGTQPVGGKVVGYSFQNLSDYDQFIGDVDVTTDTANGADISNLGHKLVPGDSWAFHMGRDRDATSQPLNPVYSKCSDDAGANGCPLSVIWFTIQ